jgi:serine protease Do
MCAIKVWLVHKCTYLHIRVSETRRIGAPEQTQEVGVNTIALSRRRTVHHAQYIWLFILSVAFIIAQTMVAAAQSRPATFADLADKVSPSVVNITTSTTVAASTEPGPVVPDGSPFEDFFRDFMDRNGPNGQAPRRSQALGSGFVISEDGFIVTNNHVIQGADEVLIEFFEGFELEAKIIGTDPNTDLALLKVESDKPLKFVAWGDSEASRVGDWVMAMGNPLGQGFSVSAGIVSARGRALSGQYDDYIQTDAAINRGNSGGPLFNMSGEVIGVNTAILSPNGGSIGIGFAMSSRVAENVINQLRDFGETRRGWLGVRIQDITDDLAEGLGLADVRGALVTDVPEGPALDAGMESGDVILSFDGVEVEDTRGLVAQVANTEVGKEVRVMVFRDGKTETLRVTLGRREEAEGPIPASVDSSEPLTGEVLGLTVSNMTDELRTQLGLDEQADGLVVAEVAEDSEAFEKGLRAGDLITEAGQEKVSSVKDLEARVDEAREAGRKSLLLLVRRDGDPRFVALSLDAS